MDKNDHQPVPDPKSIPYNYPTLPNSNLSREKVNRTSGDLQILTHKVSQLEGGLKAALDGLQTMAARQEKDYREIVQLRVNLKLTIRAIERLAKGKSLGALGLPADQEWDLSV